MATKSRDRIVHAALEALRTKGYAGASARTIGSLADVNPGLIFYYFESLDDLLIAALRESSEERLEQHRAAAEQAGSPSELVALLRRMYEEDLASGHVRVVCEMVGGSIAHPQLGPQVVALMEPWVDLAEAAVKRVLGDSPAAAVASPRELALAAVTFYLGANLVTHLAQATQTVDGLLSAAERAAALVELFVPGP